MGKKGSKHSNLINIQLNLFTIVLRNWPLLTPPASPSPILLPLTAPLTSVTHLCLQTGLEALAPSAFAARRGRIPLRSAGRCPSHQLGEAISDHQSQTSPHLITQFSFT